MIKFKLLAKHLLCKNTNECDILHPQTNSDQVLMVVNGNVSNKTLTECIDDIDTADMNKHKTVQPELIDTKGAFDIGSDMQNNVYVYHNNDVLNGVACVTIDNINEYFDYNNLDSISLLDERYIAVIDSTSIVTIDIDTSSVILSEYPQANHITCKDSGANKETERIAYVTGGGTNVHEITAPFNNGYKTTIYRYKFGSFTYFVVDYDKKASSL